MRGLTLPFGSILVFDWQLHTSRFWSLPWLPCHTLLTPNLSTLSDKLKDFPTPKFVEPALC